MVCTDRPEVPEEGVRGRGSLDEATREEPDDPPWNSPERVTDRLQSELDTSLRDEREAPVAVATRGSSNPERYAAGLPTASVRLRVVVLAVVSGLVAGGAVAVAVTGLLADRVEFSALVGLPTGLVVAVAVGLLVLVGAARGGSWERAALLAGSFVATCLAGVFVAVAAGAGVLVSVAAGLGLGGVVALAVHLRGARSSHRTPPP